MTEPENDHESNQLPLAAAPGLPSAPTSYSPILSDHPVGLLRLVFRQPPARARLAWVFLTRAGHLVDGSVNGATTFRLLLSRIRRAYAVDLGRHVATVRTGLPCKGDTFAFAACVDLIWQVTDAVQVVRDGITDIRRAVAPSLLGALREVTRQHTIEATEVAEEQANAKLVNVALGREFGLSITAFVRLSMDQPSLEHAALRRRVTHLQTIIAAGDYDQFALQLAMKPDDVDAVMRALMQARDTHRQSLLDFVTRLLESDAMDRWQIDDHVRTTLQWLRDTIDIALPGTEQARLFAFGDASRDARAATRNGIKSH